MYHFNYDMVRIKNCLIRVNLAFIMLFCIDIAILVNHIHKLGTTRL